MVHPLVSERAGVARSSRERPNAEGEQENEDESAEVVGYGGVTVAEVSKRIGVKTQVRGNYFQKFNKIKHNGSLIANGSIVKRAAPHLGIGVLGRRAAGIGSG